LNISSLLIDERNWRSTRTQRCAGHAHGGAAGELLRESEARKYAAKWFYAAPWAASIEESHAPSPARDAALEQHWREAGALERAFAKVCGTAGADALRACLQEAALRSAPAAWL